MSRFQKFKEDISGIKLPEKFTFPFYYQPHRLAEIAVKEVQIYLKNQKDFEHNFGFDESLKGAPKGKMFGVLVVKNRANEIGYLAAYSGYLADKSFPEKFVPPLFNMHQKHSFYTKGENKLNVINAKIKSLESDPKFIELQATVEAKTKQVEEELKREKDIRKASKKNRKARKKEGEQSLDPEAMIALRKTLAKESFIDQFSLKDISEKLAQKLLPYQSALEKYTSQIAELKTVRKNKSAALQQKIFDQYQFLNLNKSPKSLTEIFPNTQDQKPPGGAGDCSAPKLLQYAFANDLMPIAMAEFWWGISPKAEVRKHGNYYPACQGRCKPILTHMLDGIEMDENPLLNQSGAKQETEIVFEDDSIVIVNKPPEFLSVPGKEITDSVYTRIKNLYPDATGPLIVHRLDMSTSGILLLAKTKEAHKILQAQFMQRTVKKRYVALLDGNIEQKQGYIELPLRVDLDDRPRQLVCYEYGKPAKTRFQIIEQSEGKTRVHLYPITGRTHQLRVHVSHSSGLNTPIVGDDLYGKNADRLHLHAEFIEFLHPMTGRKVRFSVEAGF